MSDVKSRFNPDWLTGVFTTIIAFISVAALIYAHLQLKEAHEESQVQHLLSLQQQYEQEPMVTYRKVYATKRLAGVEDPPERYKMLDFFEEVALLVKRGYLSETDVWETFSSEIFPLYADSRDTIEQERKKDDPVEYSNLISLVNRLEAIESEQKGGLAKPSKQEIVEHWKDEAAVGVGTPTAHHKAKAR